MEPSYRIIPVSLIIFFAYVLSWWFTKEGILTTRSFRKFWNLILLISFVSTAILGLILAVNIEFKQDLSWIKKALQIHVYTGIGLFISGVFHLIWHLEYFGKFFRKNSKEENRMKSPGVFAITTTAAKKAALFLGFSSMLTQLVFLRQFFDIFENNEMVIGLVLAAWMLYTGLGAWVGNKTERKIAYPGRLVAALAGLPLVLLVVSYPARAFLFPAGVSAGPVGILLFTLLFFPFAVLSGYLFSTLSRSAEGSGSIMPEHIYYLEAGGAAIAGIFYTGLSRCFIPSIIMITFLPCVGFLLMYDRKMVIFKRRYASFIQLSVACILLFVFVFTSADKFLVRLLFNGQELLFSRETPFGRLSLAEKDGQLTFFNGSMPMYSSGDVISNEENVHYALLQVETPRRVLAISGDLPGLWKEVQKYKVEQFTYLSVNPWYTRLLPDTLFPASSDQLNVQTSDPVEFLVKNSTLFDAILINVSDPSTAFLNKFFTKDFMELLKNNLNKTGILSFSLPTSLNYSSMGIRNLDASLLTAMKTLFKHTLLIPGNRLFFLASDGDLDGDIAKLTVKKNIENAYINPGYIDDELLQQRRMEITTMLDTLKVQNSIWKPDAYVNSSRIYLDQFHVQPWMPVILFLMACGLLLLGSGSLSLFLIGFSTAGLEFLVLNGYQATFGNLFMESGLLMAIYMGSLALGAALGRQVFSFKVFWKIGLITLALLAALIPFCFVHLNLFSVHRLMLWLLFNGFLFMIAFLSGLLFTLALRKSVNKGDIAGRNYSNDLVGSAAGMLLVSLLLFPVFGAAWCVTLLLAAVFALLLIP